MTVPGLAFGDTSTAEYLFQQGLDAMKRNQFKEACDAFAGSNEADPSPGTQINLALCNEKQNKLASAWGWYRTAAGSADQRQQKERAELARGEASKLEAKLHKLVISVKLPTTGMTVTRNGAAVPSAVLGTDVPIDPGDYLVEVNAPAKKTWKQIIHIASGPGVDRMEVPALEDAPVGTGPGPGPVAGGDYNKPVGSSEGSAQRTVGFVLGGAGILALVTAGGIQIFNLAVTDSQYKDIAEKRTASKCGTAAAESSCGGEKGLDSTLQSKDDARNSNELAAIIVGATGGAMVVAGIVLLLTAPSGKSAKNTVPLVVPLIARDAAGLGFQTRF
jgi:hypothetical protein